MAYQVLSDEAWAKQEFGHTNLGDKRLNDRVVKVALAMAADPAGSLPAQCGNWGQSKGAYRLFNHEKATFESVSQSHWQQTRKRCLDHSLVLLIQDTTWLDYSHHPDTDGLGWFGRGKGKLRGGNGLLMHGVLAVAPKGDGVGEVLGLAHNKLWKRTGKPKNATNKQRSKRRRSEDRESLRWRDALTEVGSPPEGVSYLHVGDRESDVFDLYEQSQKMQNVGFLVRMKHDRNVLKGHDTPDLLDLESRRGSSLKKLLRSLPAMGQKLLWIGPKKDKPGRWATMKVSATALTIYSPQLLRNGRAIRCWGVRVWEADPPEGTEPLEWLLLSSMPINSLEDALKAAEYYSLRWLIEEYHKCLKSGCKVEERQLQTADRLAPLIGMLSVVAVRLLQLKNDARVHPEKLASQCVPAELVQTLSVLKKLEAATMSVRSFMHAVAKLGGFLGRKSDGEPGYLTLWRGWQKLSQIHLGYQLAQQLKDVGNG